MASAGERWPPLAGFEDKWGGVSCTRATSAWLCEFEDGVEADMVEAPPPCLWGFIGRGGQIGAAAAGWLEESYNDARRWARSAYAEREKYSAVVADLEEKLADAKQAEGMAGAVDDLNRIAGDLRRLVVRLRGQEVL